MSERAEVGLPLHHIAESCMRLYFVRHGESEANILRVISNRGYRYGLTARGQQQAVTLAQYLKHIPISGILSSPLRRAVETADILSRALGRSYHIADALCEYDCGILENKSDDESWRLHYDIAEAWIRHKRWHRKPDQGESFMDISKRFLPFIAHLIQDESGTDSHTVLIGHGGLFRLMLPLVLTNIAQQFVHEHGIGHTTCIIAESRPEGLTCVQWGEVRLQPREGQPILE
jgi:broad specificity phosphatase PhoE